MKNLKRRLLGWTRSDFVTYREAFRKYGGSVNMNPDILQYFLQRGNLQAEFFHYQKNGEIIAAYFIINGRTLGLDVARDFPVTFDEVLIPMAKQQKFILPDSTNKLSLGNRINVKNATYTLLRKKQVCWIKHSFSPKNEKARRNEFNKFIRSGGEVKNCNDLSSEDLAGIYQQLFKLRFADRVRCYEFDNLMTIFSEFRNMLFGHILYINGKPCAYDLMLKSESAGDVYFDVPNGGLDTNYLHLSIGSVLMWLNIRSARELCSSLNKKMTFSIGVFEPQWEYKKRWATVSYVGKVIC